VLKLFCYRDDFRVSNVFNWGEDQSDNAMISIYPIGDQYYTFTEYPIMIRIDPTTLETLKAVNTSDILHILYTRIIKNIYHTHEKYANDSVWNAFKNRIQDPYYISIQSAEVWRRQRRQPIMNFFFGNSRLAQQSGNSIAHSIL